MSKGRGAPLSRFAKDTMVRRERENRCRWCGAELKPAGQVYDDVKGEKAKVPVCSRPCIRGVRVGKARLER